MRRIETTTLPLASGALPVDLATAKAHARIDITDDDVLVQSLIRVAVNIAEQHTQKRWAPRAFDLYFDANELANGDAVCIEQSDSGLVTVSFEATSNDDTPIVTPIPTTDFDLLGNRLILKGSFPGVTTSIRQADAYKFSYTVGSAPISDALRQAMLMMVAHWYEHREAMGIQDGFTFADLPLSILAILQTEKIYSV
jgi:uncharacterized phiE125 gp8 family phage protein